MLLIAMKGMKGNVKHQYSCVTYTTPMSNA